MPPLNAIIFLSVLLFPQPNICVQPGEVQIQQYLTMDLEGRTVPLLVPRRFTEDTADRVQGATHGAQLFRMDTKTFEPVSRKEAGARMKQGRIEYINLLLGDFINLERLLRTKLKGFKPTDPDGYTKNFFSKPHESGFEVVIGDHALPYREVFYLGPKDAPEIVATCKVRNDL
ncbi:MAG: hypothetical protein HKN27_03625, partial [Silicimonas sp.]|nr:hypothetical protein [Silicimonas sp.]